MRPRLTLHACDDEFALINTRNFGPNHYQWNDDKGLDWSDGGKRTLYLSQPANNAATGLPTITGTANVGQTLTASNSDIADTDGLPTSFVYQWVRVDGSGETDISGATSNTYTLAAADAGKKIKLVVSFTDIFDGEETVTSDAFPSSSTVQQTGSGTQGVEAPTITGSPALSESGSDGTWAAGATVEVTLTFSEAVTVDTTGGTPSIGLDLGGTESRRAPYLRGSGTTALVFAYTLTATDGSHTSLLVPIDSLALNGGTIRSQATSADAALSHNWGPRRPGRRRLAPGTIVAPRTRETRSPRALSALPGSHNGSSAFTFELHFSEEPEGLSYTTVAGGLLEVTGATVDKARRLTAGSNLGWEVTMTPSQSGDIAIRLPARACTETNAVCAGGRALDGAVSATVRGVPFTASFSGVPAEHDGATAFDIRFHLSAEPAGLSYRTVQNGLFTVTGGSIEKASRLSPGKNNGWTLRILPSGLGNVTVRVNGTSACDTAPGVCTADGRKLAGGLSVSTAGPAVLSVADAEVEEGADATLAFTVTLSKARSTPTTVDYATSDGTATAGSDYTSTSGTLTFAPLETSNTVSVPVQDDAHDEGSETLTLTLSNASGARLGDSTATGTINNTDPMPQAWLARFGRAAADHAIEAIEARWQGGAQTRPETHFTLGGQRIEGLFNWGRIGSAFNGGVASGDGTVLRDETTWERMDRLKAESLAGDSHADSSSGPGGSSPAGSSSLVGSFLSTLGQPGAGLRSARPRDVLMGSSFFYSRPLGEDGEPSGRVGWLGDWSAWGQTAATRFSGADGPLSLDGDVETATLGVDSRWGRWHAGVALAHSEGEGAYTHPEARGGEMTSTLTSLHPFARYEFNERTSVWGVVGYGVGGLTLTPEGVVSEIATALSTSMAAFGGRGVLSVRAGDAGRFELAIRSDARMTHTTSDSVEGLVAAAGATSRVRLVLEGSGALPLATGGVLRPTLEAGLRYDGGDAETGAGLEIGAGLGYAAGRLAVELNARTLVAHEDTEYEEWGFSGSIQYRPVTDGRGVSLKLGSAWGDAQSGVQSLWSRQDASGLSRAAAMEAAQRFEAEFGYGLDGRKGRALWVPFIAAQTSEGGQVYRMGVNLTSGRNIQVGLEMGQRGNVRGEAEKAVQLRGEVRW